MVESGGNTIGYMRIEQSKGEMAIEAKPLIEYAEEEQIIQYLEDLCKTTGKMINVPERRNIIFAEIENKKSTVY
jgi:hypothetical protein